MKNKYFNSCSERTPIEAHKKNLYFVQKGNGSK